MFLSSSARVAELVPPMNAFDATCDSLIFSTMFDFGVAQRSASARDLYNAIATALNGNGNRSTVWK
jgi:hypothetical protein